MPALALCRARVRAQEDLQKLQPAPHMGLLVPGRELAIKQVHGIDSEVKKQLAEREEAVLTALAGKAYAPKLYGSFNSLDGEEGSGGGQPCANLIIG